MCDLSGLGLAVSAPGLEHFFQAELKSLWKNQTSSIYSPNHQAGNGSAEESICQDGSQVSEEVPLAGEKKNKN